MSEMDRVKELRDAFDRGFALPAEAERPARHHILLVRLDDAPYALRAVEFVALAHDRKLVQAPSAMPALIGLSGFRGDTLPVFSLAALLGRVNQRNRWIAVCRRGEEHLGFAFDTLEGYATLDASELIALEPRPHPHLSATVRVKDTTRALVDTQSIVNLIERQHDELRRSKEQ